jgi:hypothetical protein
MRYVIDEFRNKYARAFQFVTLDGSFNILQNCSISQFATVRSLKEFRGVSTALSALQTLCLEVSREQSVRISMRQGVIGKKS